MGYKEKEIINTRLLRMPSNQRLFRINAGVGWIGNRAAGPIKGVVSLKNARPLHAAPRGWPDLAGWTTVEITPDMVGQSVAVFTGIEVKTGNQKLSDRQKQFADLLIEMGGKFEIARE